MSSNKKDLILATALSRSDKCSTKELYQCKGKTVIKFSMIQL
jgi:hypothetical protein